MNDSEHWLKVEGVAEVELDLSFNFDICCSRHVALDMPLENAISNAVHISPAHSLKQGATSDS